MEFPQFMLCYILPMEYGDEKNMFCGDDVGRWLL